MSFAFYAQSTNPAWNELEQGRVAPATSGLSVMCAVGLPAVDFFPMAAATPPIGSEQYRLVFLCHVTQSYFAVLRPLVRCSAGLVVHAVRLCVVQGQWRYTQTARGAYDLVCIKIQDKAVVTALCARGEHNDNPIRSAALLCHLAARAGRRWV